MYSTEGLEKLWFLYKLADEPNQLLIESFATCRAFPARHSTNVFCA